MVPCADTTATKKAPIEMFSSSLDYTVSHPPQCFHLCYKKEKERSHHEHTTDSYYVLLHLLRSAISQLGKIKYLTIDLFYFYLNSFNLKRFAGDKKNKGGTC